MTVIQQISPVNPGALLIQMPQNSQNFTNFDFHNDSIFECGISFDQQNGQGITGSDFFMEPFTELLNVVPPSSSKYTINGAWRNGPIYFWFQLPGGGTILSSQAPASEFTIVGYPLGVLHPVVIANNRMQNVGNVVGTVGGIANSVQDDTRTSGNNTVEATVSGDISSSVIITNDGKLSLGTTLRPGQITVNDGFGVAQWKVDSSGNQTINSGSHLITNAINSQSSNDLALNVNAGQKVVSTVNGVPISSTNGNGIELLSGTVSFLTGSISRISFFTAPVSTTPTFFNHGLGVVPTWVCAVVEANISGTFSVQVDYSTMTSTQVKLTATTNFNAACLAIAF